MSKTIEMLIEKLADQYPNSDHMVTVENFAYWLQKNAPAVERQEPVAVVLPERPLNQGKLFDRMSSYEKGIIQGAAEMWDKVKELNQ